jgi:hypothetical protein
VAFGVSWEAVATTRYELRQTLTDTGAVTTPYSGSGTSTRAKRGQVHFQSRSCVSMDSPSSIVTGFLGRPQGRTATCRRKKATKVINQCPRKKGTKKGDGGN